MRAATIRLLQREKLIESGHRILCRDHAHIALPAKSIGIGVGEIASNLLHPAPQHRSRGISVRRISIMLTSASAGRMQSWKCRVVAAK
jgi:hypothetical protein